MFTHMFTDTLCGVPCGMLCGGSLTIRSGPTARCTASQGSRKGKPYKVPGGVHNECDGARRVGVLNERDALYCMKVY
jgi:hypothetical protein